VAEAIVLLSGGLDSATLLAIAKESGYETVALTFNYGQKHKRELDSAKKIARHFKVKEHIVVPLNIGDLLKSSLTQKSLEIRETESGEAIGAGIPSTYVPARNLVFLSIATSIAESRDAGHVFIGVNAVDFSGYPDCTPYFVAAFQRVIDVGTKSGREGNKIHIETPLIHLSKAQIIAKAARLKVPFELTWSCYKGGKKACGKCDSCRLRLKGFAQAGVKDPIEYEAD
jgi:7-cyano-7-deazaguanine synthase